MQAPACRTKARSSHSQRGQHCSVQAGCGCRHVAVHTLPQSRHTWPAGQEAGGGREGSEGGRVDGRMDGRADGRTGRRADGRTDGRMGGRPDGWADGRTDGRTDESMKRCMND